MIWRVGILGAGPGVSALHLPSLSRLAPHYRVVRIADAGSGRARALAETIGARWSSQERDVLEDPEVDVVAICSPPPQHARQVLAAVAAGKRAVFCEKPLALEPEDAVAAVEACRSAGVALVVGTNHLYDPAWGRATHHILAGGGPVSSIAVTAALPPNGRYHDLVTEGAAPSGVHRPAPDVEDVEVAAGIVRQLVLGLGVHDLPLLRDLAPHIDEVVYAAAIEPVGYAIGAVSGDVRVQLTAVMLPEGADALWRIAVCAGRDLVDVEFRPAFVHDGGARVRVRHADGRESVYPSAGEDGYVGEWRALAALLDGVDDREYSEPAADADYAIALADAAADAVRRGAR